MIGLNNFVLKSIILLLTCIYLINLITVSNGYIIKDVSQEGTLYKSYPTLEGLCYFILDFLCIEKNLGDDCNQVKFPDSSVQSSQLQTTLKTSNSTIWSYMLVIEIGKNTIYIETPQDTNFLPINVECLDQGVDLTNAQLTLINDKYFFQPNNNQGHTIMGEYKLTGVVIQDLTTTNFEISLTASLSIFCKINQKSSSPIFLIQCSRYIPQGNNQTANMIILKSYNQRKDFVISFDKIFQNYFYSISNIKTYPNSLVNLQLFGLGETAILSFKTNTTADIGYFLLYSNNNLVNKGLYYPIYSDDTGTTFLSPLSIEYNTDIAYDLFYQSGLKEYQASEPDQIVGNIIQYDTQKLPSPQLDFSYPYTDPILGWSFSGLRGKDLTPIEFYFNPNSETKVLSSGFPFGYIWSSPSIYTFQFNSLLKKKYKNPALLAFALKSQIETTLTSILCPPQDTFVYDNSLAPKIYKTEKYHLKYDEFILRVYAETPYQFSHFISEENQLIGIESLVSGDTYNSIYEIKNFNSFSLVDQVSSSVQFSKGGILYVDYTNNQVVRNYEDPFVPNFDINAIKLVSFLYNDLDVTYHRQYNVLYFNYSDIVPRECPFRMNQVTNGANSLNAKTFVSTWNQTLKLFQIEFYVEANSETGIYQFSLSKDNGPFDLFYSHALPTQLRIKKSILDNQGPIFNEVSPITYPDIVPGSLGSFGWSITIEDSINGFDYGYIVIKGTIDQSIYNITFSTKDLDLGDKYLGIYNFKIMAWYPCISQDYIISEVKLFDRGNRMSFFSILLPPSSDKYLACTNPFIKFLDKPKINSYTMTCQPDPIASQDTTPPELTSFVLSSKVFQVGAPVNFSISFTATDLESGVKNDVKPKVYISNSNNQILEYESEIVEVLGKTISYRCVVSPRIGFGFPGSVLISVYGFINNNGLFSGYSTKNLTDLNYDSVIPTAFVIVPLITGHMLITEKGGDLWLYGRGLDIASLASVTIEGTEESIVPTKTYFSAVLIQGIKPTKKPFKVNLFVPYAINEIVVTPEVYDSYIIDCNNNGVLGENSKCNCNSKWTSLDIRYQCLVPNHYISSSTQVSHLTGGEITLSGWFGQENTEPKLYIDNKEIKMTSTAISSDSFKVTIGPGSVGPIQVNYTQNSILWSGIIYPYLVIEKQCPLKCEEHGTCNKVTGTCSCNSGYTGFDCSSPVNNNNNGTETHVDNNGTTIIKNQDIGYSISIDSIIELDFTGNSISTLNLTNNWIFVNKIGTVTTFNQTRDNEDKTQALVILAIEEVNDRDKDFTFAGNEFTVTKGGLKMSLSVSNWLYKSNLNTLQVQMSSEISDIQSNNCYKDERTSTIESQSNNNNLIDNINYLKITKNGNILYSRFQDKMLSDNRPTTVTAKILSKDKTSVKIALNLPHCDECLIDPDFSLLITPDYKTDCKSSKKWVIAVAVVFGVVGLAIFSIVLYLIYKKSTFLKIKVYAFRKIFTK
ncbi:hypothetical protein DICPUDRAFT_73854 [Dictyostelium purpureum]|uniref:EGF-like domain-containing protein n=1 Tax=Dictyostelium purpureum TaxID=5786 RepID=F0Z625_DICPU|nr:uncharacterized protein DICPUDRAFT_73854 [Dictyostelium purpureum]EGC40527.1 hypothetical protein DICPUDRAFT_73854 [Dictyostelium purpureum]|eukprot:XP_003282863.1 hypothetical protein DICPUDRAFT_73854 [Dictyostelium purpureum]